VHPAAIGRIVRVEADTETVRAHLPCVPELAPVIFGTGIASRTAMSLCQTAR
jgi:hypothetical protein